MTCIVGLIDKKNHNVIIGGDSASSGLNNITIRKDTKVFKNGDFVFGCTSSYRMIQLLMYSFTPPPITKEIHEYLCTDFITAMRECFRENGFIQKRDGGDEQGGTFLIAYKNRLFKIEDDFQVGESSDGYDACGCGQDFALGSLHSTDFTDKIYTPSTALEAHGRIELALKASEHFCMGVGQPFILIETESDLC